MATYYMLECYGRGKTPRAQVAILVGPEAGWYSGHRFTEEVAEPVECEVIRSGTMVSMFQGAGLLMTDEMVRALEEAGVDNLDTYAAVIRDPETGESWTNYKAVNIVGVISAVDLKNSNPLERAGELIDVPFEGVAIDETRTGGALMFRLAEAVGGIVVHERVRDHLLRAGITDLAFLEPAAWVG